MPSIPHRLGALEAAANPTGLLLQPYDVQDDGRQCTTYAGVDYLQQSDEGEDAFRSRVQLAARRSPMVWVSALDRLL